MSKLEKKIELELMQPIQTFQSQFETLGEMKVQDNLTVGLAEEFDIYKLQKCMIF